MRYTVGDKVVIKSWDELVSEYGVLDSGIIPCSCSFVPHMKPYCETEMTVRTVNLNSYTMAEDHGMYRWSDSMISGGSDYDDVSEANLITTTLL